MAISLKKGQGVSLKKSDNDLSMVTIGLGWDVAETYKMVEQVVERKKSGLGGLLGGTEKVMEQVQRTDLDLDARLDQTLQHLLGGVQSHPTY